MNAVVVIGNNYKVNIEDFKDSYVIGVDKGALFCARNNIPMDIAIGDFDSISADEYSLVAKSTKIIKLNPIKDLTDTMEAINLVKDYQNITILGGISGKRIEHFYANLLILKQYSNVKIKDDSSFIFTASKSLSLDNSYKFCSIFSLDNDTVISLSGFKYNLSDYHMDINDPLGISNELLKDFGEITINKGRILIILSKNDN